MLAPKFQTITKPEGGDSAPPNGKSGIKLRDQHMFGYMRALCSLCTAMLLASCLGIQPVPFEPFADGADAVVMEPLSYSVGNTGRKITVPAGFVTDFASTPRAIWSFLPPFGTYQKAAVIHDYLYWMQECTREQSDNILFMAMTESNVGDRIKRAIFYGVRLGGGNAWGQNAADRRAGLTRFVMPDQKGRIHLGSDDVWPSYRREHGQHF